MRNKSSSQILLLIVLFSLWGASYAQEKDSAKIDTPSTKQKIDFVTRMQLFARTSARKSADEFNADKAAIAQNKIFEEIKKTMQKANSYLKTGMDTVGTKNQLAMIEKDFAIAGDGVLTG